jgi:hypothetical protein
VLGRHFGTPENRKRELFATSLKGEQIPMSQNLPLRTAGGRGGVLVIGLVAIIAVLVIIGLILPPISLPSRLGLGGGGCKTLSAKNPTLDHPEDDGCAR